MSSQLRSGKPLIILKQLDKTVIRTYREASVWACCNIMGRIGVVHPVSIKGRVVGVYISRVTRILGRVYICRVTSTLGGVHMDSITGSLDSVYICRVTRTLGGVCICRVTRTLGSVHIGNITGCLESVCVCVCVGSLAYWEVSIYVVSHIGRRLYI